MGIKTRDLIVRAIPTDLQIRTDGEQRIVEGILVPYDDPRPVSDIQGRYTEVFRAGCWSKSLQEHDASKVLLYANHGHKRGLSPIGRGVELTDAGVGLYGQFRVSRTTDGDDALELAREGIFDSFSVGFRDVNTRWSQGRAWAERLECGLTEASLTERPVYDSAKVVSVRDTSTHPDMGPGEAVQQVDQAGAHRATTSSPLDSQRREWALRLRGMTTTR